MNIGSIETRSVTSFEPSTELLDKYAELIVGFAANVQPGQVVAITTEPGKEDLTRRVASAAYKAGAKYVETGCRDPYVEKRARVEDTIYADDLDFLPKWPEQRLLEFGELHAARIALVGTIAPGLLNDLDSERSGRIKNPGERVLMDVIGSHTTNWTVVPCPNEPWAKQVHPEIESAKSTQKLWEQVVQMCRLDEEDPIEAWTARQSFLEKIAKQLTSRQFDALHFEGPGPDGTDLTVGLLRSSLWKPARSKTVDGIVYMANLPSEEIYTAPDPMRVNGRVKATKPLDLNGTIIQDIDITFVDGQAVSVNASDGANALRRHIQKDTGANRLGEVALVDGAGLIGPMDTVFLNTLIDENAASHLALGGAYSETVGEEDIDKINVSQIHNDFMIGSNEVRVTGITTDGSRVPVLVDGIWLI